MNVRDPGLASAPFPAWAETQAENLLHYFSAHHRKWLKPQMATVLRVRQRNERGKKRLSPAHSSRAVSQFQPQFPWPTICRGWPADMIVTSQRRANRWRVSRFAFALAMLFRSEEPSFIPCFLPLWSPLKSRVRPLRPWVSNSSDEWCWKSLEDRAWQTGRNNLVSNKTKCSGTPLITELDSAKEKHTLQLKFPRSGHTRAGKRVLPTYICGWSLNGFSLCQDTHE